MKLVGEVKDLEVVEVKILHLILVYSSLYHISPDLSRAVMQAESNGNPNAVGELNEQGLFQLLPESFPQYTIEQLRKPEINIKLGVKYLSDMKKQCKHKQGIDFVVCYNAGVRGGSRIKFPKKTNYYQRVVKEMK